MSEQWGIKDLTEDEAEYLVAAITPDRGSVTKRDLRRDVQKLTAEVERLRERNVELRQLIEDSKPRIRKLEEERNAAIDLLADWQHFARGVDSLLGHTA